MNLGPQIVKDTYQYLLLQSGNSPVRKGDNSSVDFSSAGIVSNTGNQTISGVKTFASPINASVTGNAGSVTDGVYVTGNQTISGTKTFASPINASVTGNAGSVTNGVYVTGIQTISGAKTFASPINAPGSLTDLPSSSLAIAASVCSLNNSSNSFIGGGISNSMLGAENCFIGGGNFNRIESPSAANEKSSILAGGSNTITNSTDSVILGGLTNTISGSFNSSAVIAGRSCSISESNCLAHGKGALGYNQGSRVQAADFFASVGDAQYVESTLIGTLARVGLGTVSNTTYSGELVLDLVTLKRFNIPDTKVFSGRVSILVVGPNNFTASYSFPFVTHRDDGTSIYSVNTPSIVTNIINESVTTGSNNRFSTTLPYITITRLSSGFVIRCDVVVIGTSGQPSNSAIGLRAVGRVFGLECLAANTSSYY